VLLVEDDEQVRSIAHEILKLHGYRVLSAATPHEALDLSAGFREPIHLVITDVVMPQMNGRELAQRLRRARPNLQVLYMSGYAEKAFDEADALANAAFLQKPITPDLLAHNVRRVLDRRR
jgi:two-component system cell cycle sensor histidine kinase/response regulator CckA